MWSIKGPMKTHTKYLSTDCRGSSKINKAGNQHKIFLMTGALEIGELKTIVVILFFKQL